MTILRKGLATSMACLIAVQPWMLAVGASASDGSKSVEKATTNANQPVNGARELTGSLQERSVSYRSSESKDIAAGLSEEGAPYAALPFAELPVVDTKLASKARSVEKSETLRVIVHLDYLPHTAVANDVITRYSDEFERLETDRSDFMKRQANKRETAGKIDSKNYDTSFDMSDAERQYLRELADRNEVLSTKVRNDVVTELRPLIAAYQGPVIDEIQKLGGNVEFTMIAGNTLVATLPAGAVAALGKTSGVLRIVEDSMLEGHLSMAASSTMVDPADTTLTGLWDAGFDGGVYDPATIDSGVDEQHPGMIDNGSRTNFCSWYLVAGNGSANFGDIFSCDDSQGHGTHVAGIVGSQGSTSYLNELGMANGVEKMVNLKAGWLNSSTGRASMFWSDKYNLVERALNATDELFGAGSFSDDVDGFNLSYGGDTSLDDTDGGRFWDSVISTYNDTPVTISAGNSGPSNTLFSDPAVSYNAITVANFNDRGTTNRADDIVRSSSTVGPTAGNRRKPDIAAPGTTILAPNHQWESQADYVNKTGTSMAAPMVLGVIMNLMDSGVVDELSLKAILINTAQKNLAGMNIENDLDGWDEQLGWGAMNAQAAYYHRFDTFKEFLEPRNPTGNWNENDYQLYVGVMGDEGSAGEGRDRATMVWNRHATYDPAAAPSTYYGLSDINMRLYREQFGSLIDSDLDANDNVHQVRIGASAADTDVVVKVYSWSQSFSHGGATEEVAVALEEGFQRVEFPTQFQGIALWPTEVEPSEVFDITFWLRNDSDIASHNNTFDLSLPAGFTLLSGTDTQNVGSAQAGGITNQVTYTLRAPVTAVGDQTVVVAHSHNSYAETYGDFNWNMGITVAFDNTPPNPSPMSFSTQPYNLSPSQVSMTASFATDIHDPIEYYLDYVNSPSFGAGGTDSGWIASRTYTDAGLGVNHEYCYRAWARDNAIGQNLTTPSATSCTYTSAPTPLGATFGNVTTTSIQATSLTAPPNLTLDLSGLLIRNSTQGTNSGWQQNNAPWISAGLTPAAKYTFDVSFRNGDGDIAPTSDVRSVFTLANPPAVDALVTTSDSTIKVALNPNGNSNQAQYLIENTTSGTSSGWISDTSYEFAGLDCDTFHNFQAKARNGDGIETIFVPLGLQTTGACLTDSDSDGVIDSEDNCTFVPNADQRDSNGDGFGNICDADLDGNLIVNAVDLGIFRARFFSTDADADFNGDGIVNAVDLGVLRAGFFLPPGPSGLAP